MSKIRILHLSDTHFGQPDKNGEQGRILDAVIESIEKNEIRVDLITFTGDLAFSGSATQLQLGLDWLLRLQEITGGKIAVCPGNHDSSRSLANEDDIRRAYANEEAFSRSRSGLYKEHPHLTGFFEWYKSSSENYDCFLDLWKENNIFASLGTVESDLVEIKVVGINTSALSCGDDDKEKLCVDVGALNSSLRECKAKEQLVVCIGHHPISGWLAKWNSEEIEKLLRQKTGPHIYLHGHLHDQAGKVQYSSEGGGICCLSSGAAYQGSKWPQHYSVIDIDFTEKQLTPEVYSYNTSSGQWSFDGQKSNAVPVSLPAVKSSQTTKSDPSASNDSAEKSTNKKKWINPFDNVASNSLEAHIIPELFVDENNFLNRISKPFDSLVEGQRGTGKTMLLRYLSIEVQASIYRKNGASIIDLFRKNKANLGVYSRFSNAGFNRSDFEAVTNKERRVALFYHRVTLFVLSDFIASCATLVQGVSVDIGCNKISSSISRMLRSDEFKDIDNWDELAELTRDVCDEMIARLDEHIASLLPGGVKTDFNPWLTISTSLKRIMEKAHRELELTAPLFLLFDDFDTLNSEQQGAIFKVARERNHSLVCFKYGIMTLGKKNTMAGEEITYREGDDYDHILLQWHDKGSGSSGTSGNYKETVLKIADKRIEAFEWPESIKFKTLYSTWTHGNKIRKEVKELAQKKYFELPEDSRPKDFTSYWSKQGDAWYFRHLRSKKIEHQYAGPDAIIDLSSGIFRQFLEINSRIVSSALDTGWKPNKGGKIRHTIQSSQIRMYAQEMLRSLGETSGDTSALSQCDYGITSSHLVNLSNSLISLFSNRLYGDSKDAEVMAIAVRGGIKQASFVKAILDIAVRESILQRRSIDYNAKTASQGRLPTYYLNRRLAPEGNLGLKMQGRIELDVSAIELATKDSNAFVKSYGYKAKSTAIKSGDSDQGHLF